MDPPVEFTGRIDIEAWTRGKQYAERLVSDCANRADIVHHPREDDPDAGLAYSLGSVMTELFEGGALNLPVLAATLMALQTWAATLVRTLADEWKDYIDVTEYFPALWRE